MTTRPTRGMATRLVHGDKDGHGAVVVPVFDNAAFVLDHMEHHDEVLQKLSSRPYYSRGYNPTVATLEARLADIESASWALAFSTGMSAIVTTLPTLCRHGGHVIVSDQVFETTKRWLIESSGASGGEFTFADSRGSHTSARLRLVTRSPSPTSGPHTRSRP